MNNECENDVEYYDLEQKQKDLEQKQKTKGDYFCLISVICMGLSLLSVCFIPLAFAGLLSIAITITAYVLMVYVRVNYPKNGFGKVLMWVYIGLAVVADLLIILGYLTIKTMDIACS